LAEQMTALGQHRPITYESLGLISHFLGLPYLLFFLSSAAMWYICPWDQKKPRWYIKW
jgi:hypothetical protein